MIRRLFIGAACWAGTLGLLLGGLVVHADEPPGTEKQIALKVLYAGNPDTERTEDFRQLLTRHFETVDVTHYGEFQSSDADGFDVVVFDWTSTYPRDEDGTINWDNMDGFASPPAPELQGFDRPAVLIGAAGGSISNRLNIAINWK